VHLSDGVDSQQWSSIVLLRQHRFTHCISLVVKNATHIAPGAQRFFPLHEESAHLRLLLLIIATKHVVSFLSTDTHRVLEAVVQALTTLLCVENRQVDRSSSFHNRVAEQFDVLSERVDFLIEFFDLC
jgi:hypothetical protein